MKKLMTALEFRTILRGYVGKTKYALGCFGQRLTKALLDQKRRQNGLTAWYDSKCGYTGYRNLTNYEYLLMFCDGNWFAADCIGLIKGIQAGYRPDGTVGRLTSDIDLTCEDMVAQLTDVKKDVRKGEVGEMMFFSDYSHAMVVSVEGKEDIESAPACNGVAEVPIGFEPLSRMGGCGKLPWVDYGEPTPSPVKEDEVKYSDIRWVRKGDTGVEVKTVQANVGVFVDGVFGANTDAAVKKFQKNHGLEADGIVGTNTWRAIIEGWHR